MKTLGMMMLTLNEEEFIAESLDSIIPFVDEAIVIDQFSTDRTVEIAESKGARVMLVEGNFSTLGEKYFRDLAARMCSCDWMMVIDADEVMSDGWAGPMRHFLNIHGDNYGAIEIPFYHLIGSYEYHSVDSPLWRPAFVRRHPALRGTPPMRGPFAHSNYHLSYDPPEIRRFARAAIFHLGYVQKNLMKRWTTNVRRCDYTEDRNEQDATLERLEKHPCDALPECLPMTIPIQKYPKALQGRVSKTYDVAYNPQTRRITDRKLMA